MEQKAPDDSWTGQQYGESLNVQFLDRLAFAGTKVLKVKKTFQ